MIAGLVAMALDAARAVRRCSASRSTRRARSAPRSCSLMVAALTGADDPVAARPGARGARPARARILATATETAIIATDAATGTITLFNAGAERMLGYRADERRRRGDARADPRRGEVAERAAELGVEPGPGGVLRRPAPRGLRDARRGPTCARTASACAVSLTVTVERDDRRRGHGRISASPPTSPRAIARAGRAEGRARPDVRRHRHGGGARRSCSTADGRILRFNQACERLTGYARPRTCSAGGRGSCCVPPEDVEFGRARRSRGSGPTQFPIGVRDRLAHHSRRAAADRLVGHAASSTTTARSSMMINTGIDITDQRRPRSELRISTDRLQGILEHATASHRRQGPRGPLPRGQPRLEGCRRASRTPGPDRRRAVPARRGRGARTRATRRCCAPARRSSTSARPAT